MKSGFLINSLAAVLALPAAHVMASEASTSDHGQFYPKLTFIGHATVLVEGAQHSILTDPYFGSEILLGLKRKIAPAPLPPELKKIDFVLISHTHPDHYRVADLKKLPGAPTIIIPWNRGKELKRLGFQVIELRPWESYESSDLRIVATPARHMWGNCLGYVIDVDGRKIYFTGDTKLFKSIDRVQEMGIDLMLLPYGGYPVFGSIWTSSQAARAISRVKPQRVIPIHWGTFDRWWTKKQPESPESFIQLVKSQVENVQPIILRIGERFQFNRDMVTSK